ncbi:MAG: hypothetical protein R3F65_22090 [bacterium]
MAGFDLEGAALGAAPLVVVELLVPAVALAVDGEAALGLHLVVAEAEAADGHREVEAAAAFEVGVEGVLLGVALPSFMAGWRCFVVTVAQALPGGDGLGV